MLRRLRTIAVFLVLGAIANVVVAWTLYLTSGYGSFSRRPISNAAWLLENGIEPATPSEHDRLSEEHEPSFGTDRYSYTMTLWLNGAPVIGDVIGEYLRIGWPIRCFDGGYIYDESIQKLRYRGAIELPYWFNNTIGVRDHYVPVRPIVVGLAFNTVAYAAALWLLFIGPLKLRARSRERRGLCVKCGYSRGSSSVCTECGAALAR